jgi:hypothetical protein
MTSIDAIRSQLDAVAAARAAREAASPTREASQPALQDTLHAIDAFIRQYVVLSPEQAIVVTLWVAHTHAIHAFDCTPYLQITSATKRAGKTRLLEVLEPLVARPWLTGRTSAAVLVRKTDAEQPTLLLDESDAAFGGDKDYSEALRGILNSGYRRSGKASLCVGQGANLTYKDFRTFGAKAIAGIGELPGTIADRAIPIQLRRRRTDEPCARWREREGHVEAAPLRQQLAAWAARTAVLEQLHEARPALPALDDDRKAEVLEPLVAIAQLAGGPWADRAGKAALALAGAVEDTDIVVELLRDLSATLLASGPTLVTTKDILAELTALEDRPWATWRHDKPMTGRALARLLGPLGIHPMSARTVRGYRADAFSDAIARYVPFNVSQRHNVNNDGPETPKTKCHASSSGDASKTAKQSGIHWGCDAVTLRSPDMRTRGETKDHAPAEADDDNGATVGDEDDVGRL